jgi:CDP-2,3-bis-(O-geranylgeranyl)-sn-glycerol synthase
MLDDIIFALWFFLPAGIANMVPVPVATLPVLKRLDAPMDFGASLGGRRVLGPHKTWRGLVSGVIAATITLVLQQYVVRNWGWFADNAEAIRYLSLSPLLVGPILAVGALGGDAIKSFFKRRRDLKPGAIWLPYDLLDHIVGAVLAALPFVVFAWWIYPAVLFVWFFANIAVSYAGFLLHIKERPI